MPENAQTSEPGGAYECLRCGFRGRTRSGLPPKCCSHCRSAYWDRPPKLYAARAPRKPSKTRDLSEHLTAMGLLPPPAFAREILGGKP